MGKGFAVSTQLKIWARLGLCMLVTVVIGADSALALDEWDSDDDSFGLATILGEIDRTERTHGPHTLGNGDEADWFTIELKKNIEYRFKTGAVSSTIIQFYSDPRQSPLSFSTNGSSDVTYKPLADGLVYLKVSSNNAASYLLIYYTTLLDKNPCFSKDLYESGTLSTSPDGVFVTYFNEIDKKITIMNVLTHAMEEIDYPDASGYSRDYQIGFTPDGTRLVISMRKYDSTTYKSTIKTWCYDLNSKVFLDNLENSLTNVKDDKNRILVRSSRQIVYLQEAPFDPHLGTLYYPTIYDLQTKQQIRKLSDSSNNSALSPDGNSILSWSYDYNNQSTNVYLYDLVTGSKVNSYLVGIRANDWVDQMLFSPNGKDFAANVFNGNNYTNGFFIYDLSTTKLLYKLTGIYGTNQSTKAFCYNGNGSLIIYPECDIEEVGGMNREINPRVSIVDAQTLKKIRMIPLDQLTNRNEIIDFIVCSSKDKEFIAISTYEHFYLYDITDLKSQVQPTPTPVPPTSTPTTRPTPTPTTTLIPGATLGGDTVSGAPGAEITIPVKVKGLPSLSEFSLDFTFDPNIVSFVQVVKENSMLSNWNFLEGNLIGNNKITVAGLGDAVQGEGTLFSLKMKINATAAINATGTLSPINPVGVQGMSLLPITIQAGGKMGDLNNDKVVNILDVRILFDAALGKTTLTNDQKVVADVNKDGTINILDVRKVFDAALGKVALKTAARPHQVSPQAAGTVTVPTLNGTPGQSVSVPVSVAVDAQLSTLEFTATYDSAKLDYKGFDKAGTLVETFMFVDANETAPGTVKFLALASSPVAGSGTLVKLLFDVKTGATGTAVVSMGSLVGDLEGATVSNGGVTIGSNAVPTATPTFIPTATPSATPTIAKLPSISISIPNLSSEAKPLEMVLIPAGTFTMGSPSTETGHETDEEPQHAVTISKPFYLGKYEITQAQWQALMNSNDSRYTGSLDLPYDYVTWSSAQTFLEKLNHLGQGTFRLPTEAEWEYACRAGKSARFYWGEDSDLSQIDNHAWYLNNSNASTQPVGTKLANPFGLYDMIGNVFEYCSDYYSAYNTGPQVDPQGPVAPSDVNNPIHVIRGGHMSYYGSLGIDLGSSAERDTDSMFYSRGILLGLRVVKIQGDVATPTPVAVPTSTPTVTPTVISTPTPQATPTKTPTQSGPRNAVEIFDNANDASGDLTGKTDFDDLTNRNLSIHCNGSTTSATDWHVYVRKGLGGYQYLGRTASGTKTTLDWAANQANLAPEFKNGPDINAVYSFRMIRLDGELGADDIFTAEAPVGLNVTGGNELTLSNPDTPNLNAGEVVIYDDILGGNNLAPMNATGSDTDKSTWRALQVAWNFGVDASQVSDYHVYVKVDGGEAMFLGQTGAGSINYFWWTPSKEYKISSDYQTGPQGGHNYQFIIYLLPVSGNVQALESGTVMYTVSQ